MLLNNATFIGILRIIWHDSIQD